MTSFRKPSAPAAGFLTLKNIPIDEETFEKRSNLIRMRNPAPLIATLFLAALSVFLLLRQTPQKPKEPSPDVAPPSVPTTALSLLAENPDWSELAAYQNTISRADFLPLLTEIFTTDDSWQEYITVHQDFASILTSNDPADPPFILHFAKPGHTLAIPRYWQPSSALPTPPPEKTLSNLHIAIDPGHLGGKWAKIEGRWFQIGEDKPVTEGDMTLYVAKLLKPLLEEMGATVSLVRETTEPVTPLRPESFNNFPNASTSTPEAWKKFTEQLFYRTAEIRARAELVNQTLKPDLVLCLHFNAEAWGDPNAPTLVPNTHFHILLNGAYTADEVRLADQRHALLKKLLQRTHREERDVATTVAHTFAEISKLPAYTYHPSGKNFRSIPTSPYLYARNLLANRLYECPVIFMEPYIMNSVPDYNRIQAGDYQGLRNINGVMLPSIFQEYANALATGLAKHYGNTP